MAEENKKMAEEVIEKKKGIKGFFTSDIFIITSAYAASFAFIIIFFIAFVFIAFPKDPVQEERAERAAELAEIRMKSFELKEESMPSELRIKYTEEHHKF